MAVLKSGICLGTTIMLCFDYGLVGEMGPGRWMLRLLGYYILTTRMPPYGFSWTHALLSVPGICQSPPQSSHIAAQGTGVVSPGKRPTWDNTWKVFWKESRNKRDGLSIYYVSSVPPQISFKTRFFPVWWNCRGLGRLWCSERVRVSVIQFRFFHFPQLT